MAYGFFWLVCVMLGMFTASLFDDDYFFLVVILFSGLYFYIFIKFVDFLNNYLKKHASKPSKWDKYIDNDDDD